MGLGAIGAHALPKQKEEVYREVWKTASQYHMFHSAALLAVGISNFTPRKKLITGSLFSAGILLFCGSCYTVAIMRYDLSPFTLIHCLIRVFLFSAYDSTTANGSPIVSLHHLEGCASSGDGWLSHFCNDDRIIAQESTLS